MADYYAKTRTNYFGVTDEDKFREIMGKISPTPKYYQETVNGRKKFMFYCDGSLDGYPVYAGADEDEAFEDDDLYREVDEYDFDAFMKDLQTILEEDDAVLITEIGSEKFRYLTGYCIIITKNGTATVNLAECAKNAAKELLGNPEWDTRNEY